MDDDIRHLSDFHLCHEAMEGKRAAIEELRRVCSAPAISYLVNAGAEAAEATELIENLWTHLLAPREEGLPSIVRYNGSCAFQTWLNTVALNRMITRKRKEARWRKLMPAAITGGSEDDERLPAGTMTDPLSEEPDSAVLVEIMREAIEHAFRTCDPEDFVLLQLIYMNGLLGKELAVMFQCQPSGISNRLEKALRHISKETLWKVRQRDPWLELRWEDFMQLCRTANPRCFEQN